MGNIILYLKDSYNELVHKVTWPTWANLLSSTRVVIVASILIAVMIFIMDAVARGLVTNIYNINF